jgi:glycosyltransferase involved in cell wall biosynthesis
MSAIPVPQNPPRLSLIIPAYNETALLPRLLDSVDVAHAQYAAGPESVEVIVANNGSTDGTAALAAARGCRVVEVAKRAIAAARNGGAKAATGDILCFVDADSQIHPETFNAIDHAISDGSTIGGATGIRLERWSPGLALTYAMIVPLVILAGIDTGVVFCRRTDFEQLGGYDEGRLFAEDVAFLFALKRLGWRRHQKLRRLRAVKAIGSTRKFDEFGDWHYFTQMLRLGIVRVWRPASLDEFAQRYWYNRS